MTRWLLDGEEAGAIDLDDRGLAYGDGLFETIAWRDGAPRLFERHLARLADGCRRLALPPPEPRVLAAQITGLGRGVACGTVKIIVTRGSGPRGYAPPPSAAPRLAVGFSTAIGTHAVGRGARALTSSVPASENRALGGIKTLNRLDNVLAQAEVARRGAGEGIMLGHDGRLVGGTRANLFLVRDRVLFTPAVDAAGVAGVMRGLVLEIAAHHDIPVQVGRGSPQDLVQAEEIFLTSSLVGIRAVQFMDGRELAVGPLTQRLTAALAAGGVVEPVS